MGTLLSISLLSSLVLALCYITYKCFLASEKYARFNRFVLLSVYLVAFAIPVWWIMRPSGHFQSLVATVEAEVIIQESAVVDDIANQSDWMDILLAVYILGAVIVAVHTVVVTVRLMQIVRSGEHMQFPNYTLILIDDVDISPFSWRKYIIMSRQDYREFGSLVLAHEIKHLEARHWMDLYIAQLVTVLQWYNPAAWLMREELKTVHEYQAGDAVITSGVKIYDYQILLIKKAVGARFPSLANSLNHSQLKKRVNMMYKKSSSKWSRLRSLALVPAVVVAAAVFSIPAVASMINEVSETDFFWIGYKVSEKAPDDHAIRIVGYKAGEKTPDAPVIYINGKKSTKEEMDALPPSKIKNIKVDKENNKIDILLSEADEVSEKASDDHSIRIVGYKAGEKLQMPL